MGFLKLLIFVWFLCLNVNAFCPSDSLDWQTDCFFFQNETTEFMVAQILCGKMGGNLVSIHDAIINALLAQEGGISFHQSTVTDLWIGLTDMMPGGNWSWMDGTSLDFMDWAKNEPVNITGNNCAALSIVDGFWRSGNCYETKPYICKVEKSVFDPTTTIATTSAYPIFTQCPYPFTYFEPTHSCYGLGNFTGPLNWSQGERYCEDFGGHLVSIHSTNELLFLGSLVYIGHQNYWTGAFSNDGGYSWKWSDNSTWDFDPWGKGMPHLNQSACGLIWGGAITDVPCSDTYQVICKKPL